jgi:hypothetical protein
MSSFMMSNKSLSNIGKEIERFQGDGWNYGLGSDGETIAKNLYDLNASGVRERYADADQADMIQPFEYINHQMPLQVVQFFKSLQCLRYQASEGEVTETENFKKLEKLILAVAEELISWMPDYNRAKWD